MSKLTPQQAWEHVKALFPNATHMTRDIDCWFCWLPRRERTVTYFVGDNINWPKGVDRWPPPEPRWREATMADVGKIVEVSDIKIADSTSSQKLMAILANDYGQGRFVCGASHSGSLGVCWRYARIKDEGAAP